MKKSLIIMLNLLAAVAIEASQASHTTYKDVELGSAQSKEVQQVQEDQAPGRGSCGYFLPEFRTCEKIILDGYSSEYALAVGIDKENYSSPRSIAAFEKMAQEVAHRNSAY